MANQSSSQLTIPVKKHDGTVVRMTLEEVKAYKQQQQKQAASLPTKQTTGAQAKPIPPRPLSQKETNSFADLASLQSVLQKNAIQAKPTTKNNKKIPTQSAPATLTEQALATTTPVVDAFVDKAAAETFTLKKNAPSVPWSKEDTMSPLDHSHDEDVAESHVPLSDVTSQMVGAVLKRCGVRVQEEYLDRFRLAIIAFLKGIRDSESTEVYLQTAVDKGGIGLSKEHSARVLQTMMAIQEEPLAPLPVVKKEATTSNISKQSFSTPVSKPIVSTQKVAHSRQSSGRKPVLHDIKKVSVQPARAMDMSADRPTSRTTGPVDEMKQMTLVEFRRLGTAATEAADQIIDRFETQKKESYLFFLDARKAWWHSPLFKQYLMLVAQALQSYQPLSDVYAPSALQDQLTEQEVLAIVTINKYLS